MTINAEISIFRIHREDAPFSMDAIAPVWAGEMQAARGMQQDSVEDALDALETTLRILCAAFGGVHASGSIEDAREYGRHGSNHEQWTWTPAAGFDTPKKEMIECLKKRALLFSQYLSDESDGKSAWH
jgi:hypothetical protein